MAKRAVIGVGNRHRGDDAVGCLAVEHLGQVLGREFEVLESNGELGQLLEWFQTYDEVIIVDAIVVDAMQTSKEPSLFKWDAIKAELPGEFSTISSHGFGLSQAIELARALGQLPNRLIIYGIRGYCFEMKEGLSPVTIRALNDAIQVIFNELKGSTDA
jgi:hydrogenase maturation protease